MRSWFVLLTVIIVIVSGCHHAPLAFPPLEEGQVLVTHVKEPKLSVIDLEEKALIHEEKIEFNIQSLTRLNADELVVAGKLESEVLTIHLKNGKVDSLISSVPSITDLYYDDRHPLLFLTDAKHNEVLFFNLEQEKLVEKVAVGRYPNAMVADASFLYVLNGDDGAVSVIDLATYDVVRTFPVVEHPTDLIVTEEYVWVGGHGSYGELNEDVYIYTKTGELVERVKAGSMPIALYTDFESEDMFVLSHGSNEMHVIDKETFQVKEKVKTADNPYYLTGDEQYIYVTTLDGDRLHVIDRKTYTIRDEYSLPSGPYGIVLGGRSHE